MTHVVDLTLPEACDHARAGGKGANLARMAQGGFNVPPGFVVTTDGYAGFIARSGLGERIRGILAGLDTSDQEQLERCTIEIRGAIADAPVPDEIAREIARSYAALDGEPYVAVRSSGTAEDLEGTSFAGMHD